jgi:tetratricopeptide (TPR) repeat protein
MRFQGKQKCDHIYPPHRLNNPYIDEMKKILFSFLVLVGCLMLFVPASARQDDERLLALFEGLAETPDTGEAKVIEQAIWKIWLTSGSDTVDMLMFQGIQHMRAGGVQQALFLFTSIIEMDPDYAEGWNKRATLRFMIGDLQGSLDDVVQTLELEPRHFAAMAGMGQIYEQLEKPELALRAFERAQEINPHLNGVQEKIRQLKSEHADKNI